MPKVGSPDLFRLIKSLSKTEKAYFKKHAERHVIGEKNNYLKLFDAIDKQTDYDEKKLLKSEKYIRQLPYLKNYLMEMILKSMQSFYAGHTQGHQLRRMMDNAWFLYKKGLYDLSNDSVQKAKKLSRDSMTGSVYFEALRMEELLVSIKADLSEQSTYIDSVLPEAKDLLEDMLLYNELVGYYLKIFLFHRTHSVAGPQDVKKLEQEIGTPLLLAHKKARSFRCRTRATNCLAAYHNVIGNLDLYVKYSKELLLLYETSPVFIKENLVTYLSILYNYGTGCIPLKKYDEAFRSAERMRTFKPSQPDEERKIFISSTSLDLVTNGVSGNHKAAVRVFNENRLTLHRYFKQGFLQRYFILCSFAASSNAYLGNFKEALKIITHIFEHPEIKKTGWLETILCVLQIIFLSELGEEHHSFIKNLKRRLPLSKGKESAEFILVSYLEEKLSVKTDKDGIVLAERTLERLEKIKGERSYITFTDHFDIVAWLESKINKRPLLELARNRR